MAKGISIGVAADTGPFSTAVKTGVLDPLDDVKDALADTSKAGDQTGTSLEQSMKDAQTATVSAASEIKAQNDSITQSNKKNYQQDTAGFELSTREKKKLSHEGLTTIGDEAKNLVSGFDGNLADLGQSASQTAIGILQGLGPIGFAVGTVAATALGLITASFEKSDAESKQFKEDVSALTAEFEKTGKVGSSSVNDILTKLQALSQETDDSKVSLDKLFETAKTSGNSAADLAQAYAGQTDKLHDLLDAGKDKLALDQKDIQLYDTRFNKSNKSKAQLFDEANAQKDYNKYLQDAVDKSDAAAKKTDEYKEAIKGLDVAATSQAQLDFAKDTLASFDQIGDALQDKTDKLNTAAEASAKKRKATAKKIDDDTVADFIQAQNDQIKAQQKADAEKIIIYAKYGKNAAAVIAAAGSNSKLLQSIADAKPADVQKVMDNYSRLGNLAATNFVDEAKGLTSKSKLVIPSEIQAPDTDAAVARAQRDLKTKKVYMEVVFRHGNKVI